MNARSKSAVDPARALIGWFCRSKGNKARLEHLRILGGAALVDRCVDDGWIEVRRARSGEILRCACPCGADLEAVELPDGVAWRCADEFCLPTPVTDGLLAWTDEQVVGWAIRRQLGLSAAEGALGKLRVGPELREVTIAEGRSRRIRLEFRQPAKDEQVVVPLSDLVVVRAGRVQLDRATVAGTLRLPAATAGPWLAEQWDLVLSDDATWVWVLGQQHRLGARSAAVLRVLADKRGDWCTHSELRLAGWPDEVTPSGRALCGHDALDRRLRQVVGDLRKILSPHGIDARRAAGDVEGAYALPAALVILPGEGRL